MAAALRDPNFGPAQGRYELGDLIATGGMGSVHRAFDRLAQRQVAYKRLRVNMEAHRPRATALFRREYDTLARLEHPNIVSVFEFGVDAYGPFYTMELVSGEDLAKRGRMAVREACRIARDVASALALVHARRLIHRDVSPNNVKLTTTDDAKLIDFGALTGFGIPPEVVGTPQFVAPECLTQEPLDQRVDLYALGALTFFMLTRQLAIRAGSLEELPHAWELPIPPPSALAPDVPHALDDLVLQLLRVDRNARPSTAGEVVERLTTIANLPPEQDERRVAFSYLKHPPLQGRDAQLSAVAGALDALMEGRGGVLRVEGAPGTGRSALLEQIGVEAQLRGATVLRADGAVHTTPLAGALHLVRSGIAVYPELAAQFRERHSSVMIETSRANDPTEVANRHARIAASVQDALLSLGEQSPLVLLVDDAQLLDAPSLGLLASMAERVARHPILLAISRLAAAATSDAEAVLQSNGNALQVTTLSEQDVRQLVEVMFGGVPNSRTLARWLFGESGGNPRHCLGLVGWLLNHGTARYDRGTFTLPSSVDGPAGLPNEQALRLDRLLRLGDAPVLLAKLLALAETALDVMQLAKASDLPPAHVLEDLRALGEASLIVSSDGRHRLLSRSLAQSVQARLTTEEARPLHLALAAAVGADSSAPFDKIASAMHLIHAGDGEALDGALRIAALSREHKYQLLLSGEIRRPLSTALRVLEQHGYDDFDTVHILTVLSSSGFYGDLDAQRQYFDRTVRALYKRTGVDVAARLGPFVGRGLALLLGLMIGAIASYGRRVKLPRSTLHESLVDLTMTIATAAAAAACALETPEAERVMTYLDPLASLPGNSSAGVLRTFTMAVVDTSAGHLSRADLGYRRALADLEQTKSMTDVQRQQVRDGCLHGLAENAIEDHPVEALAAADQLAKTTFFAPHAELVRMYYHGWRGNRARAEEHRGRAEALALLGGTAWSAVVLITARAWLIALISDDLLELARLNAELARMAPLAPSLSALHQISQADLLRVRGRAKDALPLYADALNSEVGRRQPLYRINCACYARALLECGRDREAKQLCLAAMAEAQEDAAFPLGAQTHLLEQQIALADAAMGEHDAAVARLDALLMRFASSDNPLLLGSMHRDRAQVAMQMRDVPAFELHFAAMQQWFVRTQNQWLLQQCDALLTHAVRGGLRPALKPSLDDMDEPLTDMDGSTQMELRDTVQQVDVANDTELQLEPPGRNGTKTG